jgi:hypothetical protein
MRIVTDFAPTRINLVPTLLITTMILGAVLVVWTVRLVAITYDLRSETHVLQQRLPKLDERLAAQPAPSDLPSSQELAALRRRVAAVNAQIAGYGMSVSALLIKLESMLPDQAIILSLQQRRREGEIQMQVEAPNTEPLTLFLSRLEKDPQFAEVQLVRQVQARDRPGIQFELRLKERRT